MVKVDINTDPVFAAMALGELQGAFFSCILLVYLGVKPLSIFPV
jgi:hypothetical protein